MTLVSLCSPECEGVVLTALPARESPMKNGPRPEFQIRDAEDAYTMLQECQELVDRVLEFFTDMRIMRSPIPETVPVSWMKSIKAHGVCKSKRLPSFPGGSDRVTQMPDRYEFTISFSKPVFEHTNVDGRVQTIIHETCHVIATLMGERGHGRRWKDCMAICGVPADVLAEAVAELHPTLVCSKCARVTTVTATTAGRVQRGARVVCPSCGNYLLADTLNVPEALSRRVATAASKVRDYKCQCGKEYSLTPRHLKVIAKGAAAAGGGFGLKCMCGRFIDAQGIK